MKSYLKNTINNSCNKKKYFFVGQCYYCSYMYISIQYHNNKS